MSELAVRSWWYSVYHQDGICGLSKELTIKRDMAICDTARLGSNFTSGCT